MALLEATPTQLELASEVEKLGTLTRAVRASAVFWVGGAPDPRKLLADAGMLERPDRVQDKWVAVLAPLCSTSLEYIAYYVIGGVEHRLLAATGAGGSTLALRMIDEANDTDIVRLREARDDEVLDMLLDELDLQPGSGQMQSIYIEDAVDVAKAIHDVPLSPVHKNLRQLLSRPKDGPAVQITICEQDGNRTRRYTRDPLHIANLDWGSFITYSTGEGAEQQFHAGPATRENIRRALDDLRGAMVPER